MADPAVRPGDQLASAAAAIAGGQASRTSSSLSGPPARVPVPFLSVVYRDRDRELEGLLGPKRVEQFMTTLDRSDRRSLDRALVGAARREAGMRRTWTHTGWRFTGRTAWCSVTGAITAGPMKTPGWTWSATPGAERACNSRECAMLDE